MIHSKRGGALRNFLVLGYARREACERHEVSQGIGALRRFQIINQTVIKLIPYIQKELHLKTVVQ